MEITFLGAAGTVTGSKYLVRTRERTLLVDCGLFQGLKELRARNWEPFPANPREIDAVLLTHAHLDHVGYLPLLVRNGFRGPVWCTPATADLAGIILRDSGHLQEEEAAFANRHGTSRHQPALPLYTAEDAERALNNVRTADFGDEHQAGGGVSFRYFPAGHILGAASLLLQADGERILFSGDLGRAADDTLPPPEHPPGADWLLVESTYGGRLHAAVDPADELGEVIRSTAARGGVVLIPAFAVGRAQTLLYEILRLKQAGRIPGDLPVYLDSPMASRANHVFLEQCGASRLTQEECEAVCGVAEVVETVAESKRIDRMSVPRVIISASGMLTGGRVLHHLKVFGPDERSTVLFAGYQAVGTRGAQMLAGADSVKVHGQQVDIRCRVESLDGLSAHADSEELLAWMGAMPAPPKRTFIVHGEPAAAAALQHAIEERLHWVCTIPEHGQRFVLE
ncbi:MAG TPA: MBL fold metallo-hydrolase [Longimicrobiaceae bacterium]|nr:MBL fold metallo-hydrolase [Longimicrobiaceae bacterium]